MSSRMKRGIILDFDNEEKIIYSLIFIIRVFLYRLDAVNSSTQKGLKVRQPHFLNSFNQLNNNNQIKIKR